MVFIIIFASSANSSMLSQAPIGTSAKKACKTMYFCYANTISSIYYPKFNTEIWYSSKDRNYFYVFKEVSKATKFHWFNYKHKFYGQNNNKYGGTYIGYFTSLEDAKVAADPKLFKKIQEEKKIISEKKIQDKKQEAIMFTINDKREQCEAIGFKPETEKFADCVLRLVELDVKKQQSNKIAQAQQSGNDALVKELQRQQYDRGTDALLNLGQQLLNPGTTNSNIYMPQTQRCTIQGFGTFAKMVCR